MHAYNALRAGDLSVQRRDAQATRLFLWIFTYLTDHQNPLLGGFSGGIAFFNMYDIVQFVLTREKSCMRPRLTFEKVIAFLIGLACAVIAFAVVINIYATLYAKVVAFMYIIATVLAVITLLVVFRLIDGSLPKS